MVFCYKCGAQGFSSEEVDKAAFCVECGEHLLEKEEIYEFRAWFKEEYKRKLEQEEKQREYQRELERKAREEEIKKATEQQASNNSGSTSVYSKPSSNKTASFVSCKKFKASPVIKERCMFCNQLASKHLPVALEGTSTATETTKKPAATKAPSQPVLKPIPRPTSGEAPVATFCSHCGAKFDIPNAKFCITCGHNFDKDPHSVSTQDNRSKRAKDEQTCAKCNNPLPYGLDLVNFKKSLYHQECFRCAVCDVLFDVESIVYEKNGAPCCEKDFTGSSSSGSSGSVCQKCDKPLGGGQFIESNQMTFHVDCFKCATCNRAFVNDKNCLWINQQPYCDTCGRQAFTQHYNSSRVSTLS